MRLYKPRTPTAVSRKDLPRQLIDKKHENYLRFQAPFCYVDSSDDVFAPLISLYDSWFLREAPFRRVGNGMKTRERTHSFGVHHQTPPYMLLKKVTARTGYEVYAAAKFQLCSAEIHAIPSPVESFTASVVESVDCSSSSAIHTSSEHPSSNQIVSTVSDLISFCDESVPKRKTLPTSIDTCHEFIRSDHSSPSTALTTPLEDIFATSALFWAAKKLTLRKLLVNGSCERGIKEVERNSSVRVLGKITSPLTHQTSSIAIDLRAEREMKIAREGPTGTYLQNRKRKQPVCWSAKNVKHCANEKGAALGGHVLWDATELW